MASRKVGMSLAACLLNISEARNKEVVKRIARAALFDSHGQKHPDTSVLNVFSDYDYNRSVITIASTREQIGKSVVSSCVEGFASINLSVHDGIHPCLGAIDLVPIYPLSGITLEQCGDIAKGIAEELVTLVPGSSVFLFGYADRPDMKSLADKRRSIGWFKKKSEIHVDSLKADIGPKPSPMHGITGVGASPYVMNCNVTLDTQDLALGRAIAAAIRGRSGGLKGVQAMAFPNSGRVEIACNVESFRDIEETTSSSEANKYTFHHICGEKFAHISPQYIEAQIGQLASQHGTITTGTAIVGFTPLECKSTAEYAISHGIGEIWKRRQAGIFM
ncbi:formiminotransferase N-terminal subdomain-containing protein [Rana temporaria]|uniref:formiminotransferase N-terminal subdomain-containing protein n=1 Tax=Rana temporaria TaxID=8407 RepID=UPI001AADFC42|nr:formiminotransferase N-terminal subdomain-containing protein [Rana temporaria]XP_040213324.1 formiminotransferase N-terminal subdomain-containing protein [Rana temporaria]